MLTPTDHRCPQHGCRMLDYGTGRVVCAAELALAEINAERMVMHQQGIEAGVFPWLPPDRDQLIRFAAHALASIEALDGCA